MKFKSKRFPDFAFDFGRVNVILGANGSGKSQFLSELRDAIPKIVGGGKAVYIEGGRTIKIQDVIKFDMRNFQQYDKLETAISQYEKKRLQSLADRVFDAIVVLEKKELQLKSHHSDAVEKWNAEGRISEFPKRQVAPLSRVFELFSEIFPQIILSFNYEARRLSAQKNGQTYGPSNLSDGEKQVFSILADLVELDNSYEVIVADEPELNLHPELAERLWTLLENEFENKTFIYATHSINFSLRESVSKIYVLSSNPENIAEFSGFEGLSRSDAVAFLGGLPGILSSNKVVVTEGHEKSFDAIFYRWVLGDGKLEIFPAGGCSDVVGVISKSGFWGKISTHVTLVGVVDSDFRDDGYQRSLEARDVIVMPLHEAESYLCHPNIVCSLAKRIGSQTCLPTQIEVEDRIFTQLTEGKIEVAAKRVFSQARVELGVSLEKRVLATVSDLDALVANLRHVSEEEVSKASTLLDVERLREMISSELVEIEKVVESRNLTMALKLLPAKLLLNNVAALTGCRNGMDMMRAVKSNFKPEEFAVVAELRSLLQARL